MHNKWGICIFYQAETKVLWCQTTKRKASGTQSVRRAAGFKGLQRQKKVGKRMHWRRRQTGNVPFALVPPEEGHIRKVVIFLACWDCVQKHVTRWPEGCQKDNSVRMWTQGGKQGVIAEDWSLRWSRHCIGSVVKSLKRLNQTNWLLLFLLCVTCTYLIEAQSTNTNLTYYYSYKPFSTSRLHVQPTSS